jgi:hypothetical protein
MDNVLQTALAEAVNSLASFFGTTTEAIMEHAPEFLAKYGWYSTLNNLGINIVLSVLVAATIMLIVSLISSVGDIEFKRPGLVCIGILIFCVITCVGSEIITCAVSPEIVGVHAILDLLKNVK